MKINPQERTQDLCHTSIGILDEKIRKYLYEKHGTDSIWIPDANDFYPEKNLKDSIDVVLLGGFLKSFFCTGNWPRSKYRIWVVSESVKNILVNLLGFQKNQVAVIPRYELFQLSKKQRPLKIEKKSFDLVYAGRISPSKNIECLIYLVHYLQTAHKVSVKLSLFGDFDNMFSADRGRWEKSSYEKKIKNLIKRLKWKSKPTLMPKMPPQQWPKRKYQNPTLINLSTFLSEDFDVSLAQVQELGWPSLITNWGGHRDQQANNAFLMPWQLIGRSDESENVISEKAKFLAEYIVKKINTKSDDSLKKILNEQDVPAPINTEGLDALRRDVLEKIGTESRTIENDGLSLFADTESGQKFFASYRNIFGRQDGRKDKFTAILINDLNKEKSRICQDIRSNYKKIISSIHQESTPVLLSIKDAVKADNITTLLLSEKIYFSFLNEAALPVLKTILFAADKETQIIVCLQRDCSEKLKNELNNICKLEQRVVVVKAGHKWIE